MSNKSHRTSDLDRYLGEHPDDADALLKREPMIHLASALLELRAALNLSQDEFARLAGLLPSQLSEYEHAATSGITLQTLCRIAGAAGAGLRVYFNLLVEPSEVGRLCAGVVGLPVDQLHEPKYVARPAVKPMVRVGIAA